MSDIFSSFLSFLPIGSRSVNADFADQARQQMDRILNPPVDPELQRLLDSILRDTQTAPTPDRGLIDLSSLITEVPAPAEIVNNVATTVIEPPPPYIPAGPPPSYTPVDLPPPYTPFAPTQPITETITLPIELPPPYKPTIIPVVDDVIIGDVIQEKVASAMPFISVSMTLLETASKIITIAPFLLLGLILSKEKVVQNINVEITAGPERKIYEIGFGKKDGEELSIAMEVQAGKPLRFLRDKSAAVTSFVNPIFTAKGFFSKIPLLNVFVWKRQKYETDCNITILDAGNPELQNEPDVKYLPLSKNEGFNIIRKDPTLIRNLSNDFSEFDRVDTAESSEYASLNSVSVKVMPPISKAAKHRTQIFDLPFNDDPAKADAHYLKITQYS